MNALEARVQMNVGAVGRRVQRKIAVVLEHGRLVDFGLELREAQINVKLALDSLEHVVNHGQAVFDVGLVLLVELAQESLDYELDDS